MTCKAGTVAFFEVLRTLVESLAVTALLGLTTRAGGKAEKELQRSNGDAANKILFLLVNKARCIRVVSGAKGKLYTVFGGNWKVGHEIEVI